MFRQTSTMPVSKLYDENDFYRAFEQDLRTARRRIIIESPFITKRRFYSVLPLLEQAMHRGITIVINTRSPDEHKSPMLEQAQECVGMLQQLGVMVLYTSGLHRKLAILDDTTWEGSLNILSQVDSCEIMRRTQSREYTEQLVQFTKMTGWYTR